MSKKKKEQKTENDLKNLLEKIKKKAKKEEYSSLEIQLLIAGIKEWLKKS